MGQGCITMKVTAPFGFVTGCHAGDKFMVQATLASMRHYCPDVPICLVVDGTFDVSDLERDYGVITLRVPDLPLEPMRNLIRGNYRAKLAAMWEGPFEFYVWMDSDAIVWGDFTSLIRRDLDFQIFWDAPSIPRDAEEIPSWLPHYYFDPQQLSKFDREFQWRGNAYFSTGAFACRRGLISYERWVDTESWNQGTPGGLFKFGEQGILTYLVHSMSQRGEIAITVSDLQHIPAHHGTTNFDRDCFGADWHFPRKVAGPCVAHFCGRKPFLFDRKAYSRPFTIARLEHHRRNRGNVGAWLAIINEDRKVLTGKVRERLKGRPAKSGVG